MKYKCDQCNRPATVHEVEIIKGKKMEKHLCDQHAAEHGIAIKQAYTPINELLTSFVKMHSSQQGHDPALDQTVCTSCGLSFEQFRESSLLGCPTCYEIFESTLLPLLARAHEGAHQHVGKVPRRFGDNERHQEQLLRIRKRMSDAVDAEDYELAAKLRDDIRRYEEQLN